MINSAKFHRQFQTTGGLLGAALLLALVIAAIGLASGQSGGPFTAAVAKADDDNAGERRISRYSARGRRACRAAPAAYARRKLQARDLRPRRS